VGLSVLFFVVASRVLACECPCTLALELNVMCNGAALPMGKDNELIPA
jgi:hypothetical protein